jgi:hypothetical protein
LGRGVNLIPADGELDGTTLKVYVVLAKQDRSLGPREVTRLANLSSPSVAYRQLQKLEELGLVEKDRYGEYAVKNRHSVKGYFWVGDRLFSRLVFYSFFFLGILSVEILIAGARLVVGEKMSYDFVLLITVTAISMVLFLLEGTLSARFKTRNNS